MRGVMIAVVSYGNTLREDDGAGSVLGREISEYLEKRGLYVIHITAQQIVPELIYDLGKPQIDRILFVDARRTDLELGVQVVPVLTEKHPRTMGHSLSPEMFMTLMTHLMPGKRVAWVVSIPGWHFGFGLRMSVGTQNALLDFAKQMDIHLRPVIDTQLEEELQCLPA